MPMIPFVKNGYYGNRNWIPLVNGNGFTAGGGEPDPEWKTVAGNPVSFNALTPWPLRQLKVAFSPKQDLHGYDSPWPAGGGKNLANVLYGSQVPSITNGQMVSVAGWSSDYIPIDSSKEYVISFSGNAGRYLLFYASDKSYLGYDTGFASGALLSDSTYFANTGYVKVRSEANSTNDPLMQLEVGTTPTAWTPYSNLCPISGWSEVTVYHSGADTSDPRSISITLGSTVYSGELDVLTGALKARPYFASYNGETLVGPWMSSMDKYVAGTTPTTGAQVVDMGGAETTIQLTPQEVQSLAGDNVLFSDANGDLTVEYRSN